MYFQWNMVSTRNSDPEGTVRYRDEMGGRMNEWLVSHQLLLNQLILTYLASWLSASLIEQSLGFGHQKLFRSCFSCNQCDQNGIKFHRCGKIIKAFGIFWWVYLVFGKILYLLWQNSFVICQIVIVVNGHKWPVIEQLIEPSGPTGCD